MLLFAGAAHNQQPVEEIVVRAFGNCGSWPGQHTSVEHCHFAELKDEMLTTVLEQRPKFIAACLTCSRETARCEPRTFSSRQMDAANLCKRLYWTPTHISTLLSRSKMSSEPLQVSYTYGISSDGRVRNIQITHLEGSSESRALRLLRQGSRHNQYAPLELDGAAYAIEKLQGDYRLID